MRSAHQSPFNALLARSLSTETTKLVDLRRLTKPKNFPAKERMQNCVVRNLTDAAAPNSFRRWPIEKFAWANYEENAEMKEILTCKKEKKTLVHHCRKRPENWLAKMFSASLFTMTTRHDFSDQVCIVPDHYFHVQKKLSCIRTSGTFADKKRSGGLRNHYCRLWSLEVLGVTDDPRWLLKSVAFWINFHTSISIQCQFFKVPSI